MFFSIEVGYSQDKTGNNYIESLLNLSNKEVAKGHYNKALKQLSFAEEYGDSIKSKKIQLYVIEAQASAKYIFSKYYEMYLDILKMEKLANEIKDTNMIIESYNKYSTLYNELKDTAKTLLYIKKALVLDSISGRFNPDITINYNLIVNFQNGKYKEAVTIFKKLINVSNDSLTNCFLYNSIGHCYNRMGDFNNAIPYFKKSLMYANEDVNNLSMNYLPLGLSYLSLDSMKLANNYLFKGYHLAKNTFILKDAVGLLKKYAYKIGDFEIYHKFDKEKDSIEVHKEASIDKKIALKDFKQKIQIKDLNIALLNKDKEIQKSKFYFQIIVSIVLLISIFIIILYFNRRSKYNRLINLKKIQIEKEKSEKIRLEKKLIEEKIEIKNRDLVTKTMLMAKNEELINKIDKKLIDLRDNSKKSNKLIIDKIRDKIRINKPNFWDEFYIHFNTIHKDFVKQMNDYNLTSTEQKVCILIKLNMNTKDIAQITFTSSRTIEKHRENIRKKIALQKDDSLYDYLANL